MKYFKLFNSVKIINGYNRTLIFDSTRVIIRFIPNDLYELLHRDHGFNLTEIKRNISANNKVVIDQYLNFLVNNNFGFYCNTRSEFESFGYKDLGSVKMPYNLSYIIIDVGNDNIFDANITKQIIDCNISYLQLRFCEKIKLSEFKLILRECESLNDSFIQEISFVLEFDTELYDFIKINKLSINKFLNFVFHSSENENVSEVFNNLSFNFLAEKLILPISCGIVRKSNFVFNEKFYSESKQNNSCLNRKISIDKNGDIRNCPSMKRSFGNIKQTLLENVLKDPDFIFFWNIGKDQINVCKDCEFRHICTDCRAYLEEPDDNYSKPLKCGYNPYTNIWEEWSLNPLKKETIEFYGMENLSKLF